MLKNKNDIVTAIWCKKGSEANGNHEKFEKVSLNEIDFSPLSWENCDSEKGLLFGAVRHYILVLKNGMIPPKYLSKEI